MHRTRLFRGRPTEDGHTEVTLNDVYRRIGEMDGKVEILMTSVSRLEAQAADREQRFENRLGSLERTRSRIYGVTTTVVIAANFAWYYIKDIVTK